MMTNTFASAVLTQPVLTENGMVAYAHSGDACVQLFYAAGAMRGRDIIPLFAAAYTENADIAIRIALWLRDVREGASERQLFKDILVWLERNAPTDHLFAVLDKIVEIGRLDDGLVLQTPKAKQYYFAKLGDFVRTGQEAKQMLKALDSLSEVKCMQLLQT